MAHAALERGASSVDLVEADFIALQAARQNIPHSGAKFHWGDARTFRPDTPPKHILCNPPFHTSRAADPALGQAFITNARIILSRHGTLWLVANRHLPYERTLEGAFASLETVDQTAGYKIIRAERPRPLPKGR
ncbi:MAG: methyltransferase [Pseudomonadota bacterium]